MIVGVPKEIKSNENRVGITPAGVHEFVKAGHKVIVEMNAGTGSGITDKEFENEGGVLVESALEIYNSSEMIIKVKEPVNQEIEMLMSNKINIMQEIKSSDVIWEQY